MFAFSGGNGITLDDAYVESIVEEYKASMIHSNNNNNLITELTVEDNALFHAISSGDHLDIIYECSGFIEVLNSKEEVIEFVGKFNPSVEIHGEFKHITEFETEEEDNEYNPFGAPDAFEERSIGFQGSPETKTTTKLEGSIDSLNVYNESLDEIEIEQKQDLKEILSNDSQDIL